MDSEPLSGRGLSVPEQQELRSQERKRVQTTELSLLSVLSLSLSLSLSLYGAWSMGRLIVERNVSRGQLNSYSS